MSGEASKERDLVDMDLGLKELERLELNPRDFKIIEQARIEARTIIGGILPHDIMSWIELIAKLEFALENANRNMELCAGVVPRAVTGKKKEKTPKEPKRLSIKEQNRMIESLEGAMSEEMKKFMNEAREKLRSRPPRGTYQASR